MPIFNFGYLGFELDDNDTDSEREVFLEEALDRADGIYRDELAPVEAGHDLVAVAAQPEPPAPVAESVSQPVNPEPTSVVESVSPLVNPESTDAWRKRSSTVGFARAAAMAAAGTANNQAVTQEPARVALKRPCPEVAQPVNNSYTPAAVASARAAIVSSHQSRQVSVISSPLNLPQFRHLDGSKVVWQSNMIYFQCENKNYIGVIDIRTSAIVCEMQVLTEQEFSASQLRNSGGSIRQ